MLRYIETTLLVSGYTTLAAIVAFVVINFWVFALIAAYIAIIVFYWLENDEESNETTIINTLSDNQFD